MRTCASALARSLARCAISSKYLPHSEWSTQVTMRTVWWGQYVSAWSAKITVQGVWRTTKCTLHPSPEEGAVPPLLGAAGDMLSRSHARKVWSVPEPDEHAACTLDAAGRFTTRHLWYGPGCSSISSTGPRMSPGMCGQNFRCDRREYPRSGVSPRRGVHGKPHRSRIKAMY